MTEPVVIARTRGLARRDEAISIGFTARHRDRAIGIGAIDELDLLPTRAGFYLLLARDRAGRIIPGFVVDQLGDIIAIGKSGQQLLSMLMNPEIASYTGIEHRVALVCQNVDAVEFFHAAPPACHCEERSDEAIWLGHEIASLRSQ
jgi:hypothetical protein